MKMKKIISILTLMVFMLALSACSTTSELASKNEETTQEETTSENDEVIPFEINEDNYQSLTQLASEYNLSLTAQAIIKVPGEMFDKEDVAFSGVYTPYSENIEWLDDGYSVQSSNHGMRVFQTMTKAESAKEVVENRYAALLENENFEILQETQTNYEETMDISYREVYGYNHETSDIMIMILYADTKGNGYYLDAEIEYLIKETDELYESMIDELSFVFALELPFFPAFE